MWIYQRGDGGPWKSFTDGDAYIVKGHYKGKPDPGTTHTRPQVRLVHVRTGNTVSACLYFFGSVTPQYPSQVWDKHFFEVTSKVSKQALLKWLGKVAKVYT